MFDFGTYTQVNDDPLVHNASKFAVKVNKDQDRLSTFYLLPKQYK